LAKRIYVRSFALVAAIVVTVLTLGSATGADVLRMGLVPSEDPRVIMNDNQVLLDELQKSMNM